MSDLLKRLRGLRIDGRSDTETMVEAADEIARLRGLLAEEDRAHDQTLKERDHAEDMADKLAAAVAALLGVEIGEHSSGNCPWTEALDAFEERSTDSATAVQCQICESTKDVAVRPIMGGGPVCSECFAVWYETGACDSDSIRKIRAAETVSEVQK